MKKSLCLSLVILIFISLQLFFDSRTKIVFCDVGQGDATYIRIKNKMDVLIDAGPNKRVLNCLGKFMPFYDRKIELIIISHPQKDHLGGLAEISKRYTVENVLNTSGTSFKATLGQSLNLGGAKFVFFWPPPNYSGDANELSLIFSYQEDNFKALFMGDATPSVLGTIEEFSAIRSLGYINLLKVPHHGSKNGLTSSFLNLVKPKIAVISVGKNNSYKHPSPEILKMLEEPSIQIRRTDLEGDIVFKL